MSPTATTYIKKMKRGPPKYFYLFFKTKCIFGCSDKSTDLRLSNKQPFYHAESLTFKRKPHSFHVIKIDASVNICAGSFRETTILRYYILSSYPIHSDCRKKKHCQNVKVSNERKRLRSARNMRENKTESDSIDMKDFNLPTTTASEMHKK